MKNLFVRLAAAAALALAFACGGDTDAPQPQPVAVNGVGIAGGNAFRVTLGERLTLDALVRPESAANKAVTWTSSDTRIAAVGGSGASVTVTGAGAGEVTITVKTADGGFTDTCLVTVQDGRVAVTGVSLDKTTMALVPGGAGVLTAKIWPSEASNLGVSWSSSDESRVKVKGTGPTAVVTAVLAGAATITAKTSDGNFTASCAVTVGDYTVPVTGISLGNASLEVLYNATGTLTATLTPSNAPTDVSWTSSAIGVATVSGTGTTCTITPVAAGATTITAAAGGKTAACAVTIRVIPATGMTLPATQEISIKSKTAPISVTLQPSNATDRVVDWKSSAASIVTVSGTGVTAALTPVALGTATITATIGSLRATCEVTVADKTLAKPQTLAAGYGGHSFAIKADGTLWAWGYGAYGKLGLGSTSNVYVPTQVGMDNKWVTISGAYQHSAGLKSDGTIWTMGRNNYGQLGLGTTSTTNQTTPIQMGTDTDWADVRVGNGHTIALKTDGTLWAWGQNTYGRLGLGDTTNRTSPTPLNVGNDWTMISTGDCYFSAAIKSDGSLWTWGEGGTGALGLGDFTSKNRPTRVGTDNDWVSVKAGGGNTVALKADGSLWIWGMNTRGQFGDGTIDNSDEGVFIPYPVRVGTGTDWAGFALGQYFVLGIKTDGSIWAWGWNDYGQLGTTGTYNDDGVPTPMPVVTTATNFVLAAAGSSHALYVRADGSLYVCGANGSGDIGMGNTGSGTFTPNLLQHSMGGWRVPTP